jgi:16S rRNA C967 or C1407 C5-methylase (RsmB/RsmF family)
MASSPFARYRTFLPDAEWGAFTRALDRPEPRTFRIRAERTSPHALLGSLRAQGFDLAPLAELPGVVRVDREPFPLSETLEHWLGLLYIQQAATCLPAPVLAPRPGEGVLDLCAAPGGKTSHLADLMEDRGCLVAVDLAERRVQALAGNLSRLAHTSVISVVGDALRLPEVAPFHRVLADVPCSGEGRSRRDGPVVASSGDLRRLPRLQEALLRKALRMVPPGGRVLYVTCTLAPEENEAVVDRVLRSPDEGPGGSPPVAAGPRSSRRPPCPGAHGLRGGALAAGTGGHLPDPSSPPGFGGLFLALLERLEEDGTPAPAPPGEGLPGWTLPSPVLPGDRGRATGKKGEEPELQGEQADAALRRLWPSCPAGDAHREWLVRKNAIRLHRFGAWPLDAWEEAGASTRILSAGLRAWEVERSGNLRVSGDLLRWLGPRAAARGLELEGAAWLRLLDGAAFRPAPEDLPARRPRGRGLLSPARRAPPGLRPPPRRAGPPRPATLAGPVAPPGPGPLQRVTPDLRIPRPPGWRIRGTRASRAGEPGGAVPGPLHGVERAFPLPAQPFPPVTRMSLTSPSARVRAARVAGPARAAWPSALPWP